MRGRSAPFADPSLTALQARHVWLPDAGASTLMGVTEPAYASSKRNERFFLPSLPSLEHVLIDASGRQYVVLRANQASIQLTIEGADLTARPVAITFLVPGFDRIVEARNQLDLLDRVLSPNRAPSSVRKGPPYRRHGGRIVYRLSDLLAWSEQRRARHPKCDKDQEAPPVHTGAPRERSSASLSH